MLSLRKFSLRNFSSLQALSVQVTKLSKENLDNGEDQWRRLESQINQQLSSQTCEPGMLTDLSFILHGFSKNKNGSPEFWETLSETTMQCIDKIP